MNKRQILTFAVFATILFSYASCKSREEKVISRFESLSERIDKKGHTFDAEDWAEAFEDLEDAEREISQLELSRDFISAGFLDRAEMILLQLAPRVSFTLKALVITNTTLPDKDQVFTT